MMTLKQFIKEYRAELDACIARALGEDRNPLPNDAERRLWVSMTRGCIVGRGVKAFVSDSISNKEPQCQPTAVTQFLARASLTTL